MEGPRARADTNVNWTKEQSYNGGPTSAGRVWHCGTVKEGEEEEEEEEEDEEEEEEEEDEDEDEEEEEEEDEEEEEEREE